MLNWNSFSTLSDLIKKGSDISDSDEILFDNEWITVKQTKDEYVYAIGALGVAILPYRIYDNSLEILLREECNPINDDFITIITGRTDDNESFEETAIRELEEEAGISNIDEEDLMDMGDLILGKDRALPDRIFLVNVTDGDFSEPKGDGSIYEKNSRNFWAKEEDLFEIIEKVKDSYVLSTLAKFISIRDSIK